MTKKNSQDSLFTHTYSKSMRPFKARWHVYVSRDTSSNTCQRWCMFPYRVHSMRRVFIYCSFLIHHGVDARLLALIKTVAALRCTSSKYYTQNVWLPTDSADRLLTACRPARASARINTAISRGGRRQTQSQKCISRVRSPQTDAMLIILLLIIFFHVAAAVLLFVATIHNVSTKPPPKKETSGQRWIARIQTPRPFACQSSQPPLKSVLNRLDSTTNQLPLAVMKTRQQLSLAVKN